MALVNGTNAAETLNGTSENDIINGFDGNDRLLGGVGDDVLFGGSGNDVLNGGTGIDTASYSDSTAAIVANLALTTAQNTFGAGNDTLFGIENLIGSAFNDNLSGNAGDNVLDGLGGIDTVYYSYATSSVIVFLDVATAQNTGGDGVDTLRNFENLTGSAFDDVLGGTGGNNVIKGGTGNDWVFYGNAQAAVNIDLSLTTQQDTLGAGKDTLIGIENIIGSAFNDRLRGNAGDNIIDGGAGIDQVSYAGAGAGISASLRLTSAQNTGGAGIDTLRNLEQVVGSNFDDVIEGNGVNNVLRGGDGIDRLSYANSDTGVTVNLALTFGQVVSVAKTDTLSGFEDLTGSNFTDALGGDAGNNVLDGGGGIDTVFYGGAASGVTVSLAIAGPQDTFGAGIDTLINFENLTGSGFDDVLAGDAGNNVISGAAGRDTADYGGAAAAVRIDLQLTLQQDTLGAGRDKLVGIENLAGSGFADTLIGNTGNNVLGSGAGDDTLTGGGGDDWINGGSGDDTAVFSGRRADYSISVIGASSVSVTDLRAAPGDGADILTDVEFLRFSDMIMPALGLSFVSSANFSVGENNILAAIISATNPGPVVPGPIYQITGGADAALFTIDAASGILSFLTAPDFEAPADSGSDNRYNLIVSASDDGTVEQAIEITVTDIAEAVQLFTGTADADVFSVSTTNSWMLSGLGGTDTLTGGSNADIIIGGKGNDSLAGGGNDDIFRIAIGDGIDSFDGGAGFDRILATFANAAIGISTISNVEAIEAGGFAGVRIVGGSVNDALDFSAIVLTGIGSISGLAGNDSITGSAGADRIIGGGGRDMLTGNAGADVFAYASATQSGFGSAKADLITDFAPGSDTIDLSAIDAVGNIAGNQAFTFIGSDPFTALGQLRIGIDADGHVALFGNISGTTAADFQISFDNNAAITVTDLLL